MLIAATIPDTVRLLMRGQIDWLSNHGYEIEVCTSSEGLSGLEGAKILDSIRVHHFIDMTRDISIIKDFKALLHWIKLIRRLRPEFLIANTPKASLLSLIAGRICNVPKRIYILRGLRFETATGLSRFILRQMELICVRSAHVVVAVSPSLAKLAVAEGFAPQKIRVIGQGSSNGVDATRFHPSSPETRRNIRSQHGYSDDDFVLGFVGRLTPDKGINTLVEAVDLLIEKYPNIRLLTVGPSEGSKIDSPWALNLGAVEKPEDIYPIFDALVFPTRREGFPNATLEAAACEIPVIASNATGAIDSVVDGVTGFIANVDDSESFANKIEKLVTDRALGQTLGRNGRMRVLENFAPEMIWAGLDKIYQSM